MHAAPIGLVVIIAAVPAFASDPPLVARLAADKCDFAGALAIIDLVRPDAASDLEVSLFRARLLIQLERYDEAKVILGNWLSRGHAGGQDARFLLGLALAGAGNTDLAIANLRTSQRDGADPVLVDGAIGMALTRARQFAEAESAIRGALRRDPKLTGALYNLGALRAQNGQLAEAAALVRQAWFLGLRNPAKLKVDPWLGPVRISGLIDDLISSSESSWTTY